MPFASQSSLNPNFIPPPSLVGEGLGRVGAQLSPFEVNTISSTCYGEGAPEQGPSVRSEERGGSLQIPPLTGSAAQWVEQASSEWSPS